MSSKGRKIETGLAIVKEVLSGDTAVLSCKPKNKGEAPVQKTLILSGVQTPRLARGSDGVDEVIN